MKGSETMCLFYLTRMRSRAGLRDGRIKNGGQFGHCAGDGGGAAGPGAPQPRREDIREAEKQ